MKDVNNGTTIVLGIGGANSYRCLILGRTLGPWKQNSMSLAFTLYTSRVTKEIFPAESLSVVLCMTV